uniref:WAP four-disulfide core domain 10 n=2 Tax=Mus musculus TaxID=10090 RepID=Q09TK5_MOUSE|nr:WAP four-disulfide core domain 10 [Mus musculus]
MRKATEKKGKGQEKGKKQDGYCSALIWPAEAVERPRPAVGKSAIQTRSELTAWVAVMLSRNLLLFLGVLLLLSLADGGVQRRQRYEAPVHTEIKECEGKPKRYLCSRHCEAHQDCQANNICCSAACGNVCVNLLDKDVWEMPVTPPSDYVYPESGSPPSFEGDMILPGITLSSLTTAVTK